MEFLRLFHPLKMSIFYTQNVTPKHWINNNPTDGFYFSVFQFRKGFEFQRQCPRLIFVGEVVHILRHFKVKHFSKKAQKL